MKLVTLRAERIECEGYRCMRCGNEVVTIEQMRAYGKAVRLRELLPEERKVVRVGNSIGITLPTAVSKFGLVVGSIVRVSYVTDQGFYIEPAKRKGSGAAAGQ
ncbi:MAG: hypothetical protein AB1793_09710 [Candidatus Thermoplasmatota archaeon]